MAKAVIIHVGFGKTGSSAIQHSLSINADSLQAAGIYCCDIWLSKASVGEHGFSSIGDFNRSLSGDKMALAERLAAIFSDDNPTLAQASTIIWSNEALAMQWELIGGFLPMLPLGSDVKIVIYLRHQVDWLISGYLQWCIKDKQARGHIRSWADFVKHNSRTCDYFSVLENWQKHALNATLLARSYDTIDSSVSDFFQTIGIDIELIGAENRIYETPSYAAHALFKILNDQYDDPKDPQPLQGILGDAGLLRRELHSVDPCLLDVSAAELDFLEESFMAVNQRVAESFGLDLHRGKTSPLVGRREETTRSNTDLIAALLMIILRLDQKVKSLQSAVNTISSKI